MRCVLVLTTTADEPAIAGNLLLDKLYGAEIRLVPSIDPMFAVGNDEPVVADVVAEEKAAGRVPYVIPVGGSSGVGGLGYVAGSAELVDQLSEAGVPPSRVYYASGSRGTQAGLTLGAKLCAAPYRVYGVAVSGGEPEKIERAKRIANEAATRLGLPERLDFSELITDQHFIGDGYGIPTEAALEAIRVVAATEAIVLDPCYTSKAMAALIQHARSGELAPSDCVVFLHTGGMPALFTEEFCARMF
jgi:1-aminocyclopropane-1-carboxylate deaminase/D-cysteine desulfhydrase-like pyridoxal-dependent ACC family enzyme